MQKYLQLLEWEDLNLKERRALFSPKSIPDNLCLLLRAGETEAVLAAPAHHSLYVQMCPKSSRHPGPAAHLRDIFPQFLHPAFTQEQLAAAQELVSMNTENTLWIITHHVIQLNKNMRLTPSQQHCKYKSIYEIEWNENCT